MLLSKYFNELTVHELYELLDTRNTVFVQEQRIIYVDTDEKDFYSKHYFWYEDGKLVSYLRVIEPGYKYPEHAISRVATRVDYRNRGLGNQLIKQAMHDLKGYPIRISAQAYLEPFYQKLGFLRVGEPYVEEGILHVEMLAKNTD
ncbi:MAG: GNAT family N-acetyltransferase [Candidatus Moranbacteria bacterium]|nr:GNAT family N-acetyltransferase [Candidatus Moranbacteria bacterium]